MKCRVVIEVENTKQALEISERLRKFRENPAPLPSSMLAIRLKECAKSIVAEELLRN